MSRVSDKDEKQAGAAATDSAMDFAPLPRATKSALLTAVAEKETAAGAPHLHPYLLSRYAQGFVATRLASRAQSALYDITEADCSTTDVSSGIVLNRDDTVVLPYVPESAAAAPAPLILGATNATTVSEDAVTPTNASASMPAWGCPSNLGTRRLSESTLTLMSAAKPKIDSKRSMSAGTKFTTPLVPFTFQS